MANTLFLWIGERAYWHFLLIDFLPFDELMGDVPMSLLLFRWRVFLSNLHIQQYPHKYFELIQCGLVSLVRRAVFIWLVFPDFLHFLNFCRCLFPLFFIFATCSLWCWIFHGKLSFSATEFQTGCIDVTRCNCCHACSNVASVVNPHDATCPSFDGYLHHSLYSQAVVLYHSRFLIIVFSWISNFPL